MVLPNRSPGQPSRDVGGGRKKAKKTGPRHAPKAIWVGASPGIPFSGKPQRFLELLHHLIDNRAGRCSLDHP